MTATRTGWLRFGLLPALVLLVLGFAPAPETGAEDKKPPAKAKKSFQPVPARPLVGPIRLKPVSLSRVSKGDVARAVESGLAWLAAHQEPDGYWGVKTHAAWCDGKKVPVAEQTSTSGFQGFAVSVTALALNAFFEAGYTPTDTHPYGTVMRKGLDVLCAVIDKRGGIGVPEKEPARDTVANRWVFDHALACWALCRAAALTGWFRYEEAARRTLAFTEELRNPYFAWRYGVKPGDNDTVVTGCMLLGPSVARRVQKRAAVRGVWPPIRVGGAMFDGVSAWLEKVTDPDYGRVGYEQRGTGPNRYQDLHGPGFDGELSEACTALAAVFRTWRGDDFRKSKLLKLAFELVVKVDERIGPTGRQDEWHLWWAADWMRLIAQVPGRHTRQIQLWRSTVVRQVLLHQTRGGERCGARGSWDPEPSCWGRFGGRVYTTSIALMTLLRSGYERVGQDDPAAVISDRKELIPVRLDALERAGVRPGSASIKALRKALGDKSPFVRTAAADALALAGVAAKSARGVLGKRVAREPDARARGAQVWALHRVASDKASAVKALAALMEERDVGVRFLIEHAQASRAKKLAPERAKELDARTSAHDALLAAERAGWLHTEPRAKRAARMRWHLLDENNLPSTLAIRADKRLGLVPHHRLMQPGVLEALEAAMAEKVWDEGSLADLRKLHDAAVATVVGQDPGAVVLRATLDLDFARRLKASDDPERILPDRETRMKRFRHARAVVHRSRAELDKLAGRLSASEEDSAALAVQLLSAYLSVRSIDLFDTPDLEAALVMISSARRLLGVLDAYESTTAGRFLVVALLDTSVAMGKLVPVSKVLRRRVYDYVDRALSAALVEAQTVDGRRVVVRALTVIARALVTTKNAKHPDGDVYVDSVRDRVRMHDLGRTGAEVDLILAWAAFKSLLGDNGAAQVLAQEALAKARALGDTGRSNQAAAALKRLRTK